ncbi:MAG: hypothetical protein HQ509_02980 [Candidatus Marinimicrobia bacterium]|nr:hypothetical protein [Candidatus Neomarinimicrobiota bacterium]
MARQLLNSLKTEKMVIDWKKKQQTRAGIKQAIEIELNKLPPVYKKDIYDDKCNLVYKYVWEIE